MLLRVRVGVAALPRLDPKLGFLRRSEDAFFLARSAGALLGGLADGVGSMRARGLDPSAFPRALMARCHALALAGKTLAATAPAALLAAAAAAEDAAAGAPEGASTACVFRLRPAPRGGGLALTAVNLGDCALLVFRGGARVAAASTALRRFDQPFQLGRLAGVDAARFQAPADAAPFEARLAAGDTVLLCSDGLTDNVFMHEIEARVARGGGASAAELARALVADAHARALDAARDGPFALAAKDADVAWSAGGRVDDITAIVLRVEAGAEAAEGDGAAAELAAELAAVLSPIAEALPLVPRNEAPTAGGAGGGGSGAAPPRRAKKAAPTL